MPLASRTAWTRVVRVAIAIGLGAAWLPPLSDAAVAAGDTAQLIAGPWQPLHAGSRIRLLGIAGKAAGEVNAGIEIELADGWKTYWRMPGDAGVPPHFSWDGSGNVASVTVQYPAPMRLPEPAAETIGYKKHVVFPIMARAAAPGQPIALKLEAELGICKEICVPAQANLSLALPATAKAAALPEPIATAVRQVPAPAAPGHSGRPTLVSTAAQLEGADPTLVVTARFPGGGEAADLFIEAPESLYVPMSKRSGNGPDGSLMFTVRLPPSTAKDLKGKTLTLTLVGASGATEAQWRLP